jgi:paraquat-inducible protein B
VDNIKSREIIEIEAVSNSFALQAEEQEIANQTDVDFANVILKHISQQMKMIEEKRKTFTQPLNQSLREINKTFKELTTPLQTADKILSDKVMAWRRVEQDKIRIEQERIAKEEARRRKIQDAHKRQGHEISEPIVMTKPKPLKEIDTTKTRKDWTIEIIDSTKIPREYLIVDERDIREAIRRGIREIAGIRIDQKETMVRR